MSALALRCGIAGAALTALGAGPLRAQDSLVLRWHPIIVAFPSYSAVGGLGVVAGAGLYTPQRAGPRRVAGLVNIVGRLTLSGTRGIGVGADLPGVWPRWRVLGLAVAERLEEFNYYGPGNNRIAYDSTVALHGKGFFRYELVRTTASAALQREVVPRVRAHVAAEFRHYAVRPAAGRTLLGDELAAGLPRDTGSAGGLSLRAGLVYDTRDDELVPSRGVVVELLGARSVVHPWAVPYTRWLAAARVFVPLGTNLVLGVRQSVEVGTRAMPIAVMAERLTSWRPEDGFGGASTIRTSRPARWLGPNRYVVSVEVRDGVELGAAGDGARRVLWLVPFLDVGGLWDAPGSTTPARLRGGVGACVVLQNSPLGNLGTTLAFTGSDGFQVQLTSGFTF